MEKRRLFPQIFVGAICFLLICAVGCSTNQEAALEPVQQVVLPPSGQPVSVDVQANRTGRFAVAYQLPPTATRITSLTIDGPTTLSQISRQGPVSVKALAKSVLSSPNEPVTDSVRVLLRVGNDPDTVCDSTNVYGPFSASILGSSFQLEAGSPTSASADEQTLQVINSGPLVLCVEVLSTVSANISVNGIGWSATTGACNPPQNFAGQWTGTWSCGNSCTGTPFGGNIVLTVLQDNTVASYTDDGGATFSGTVCDNVFRFERSTGFETERGTMTLVNAASATKRSTWQATSFPFCRGNCFDNLVRVP